MLTQIKPHSLFKNYFNGENLLADMSDYADIFAYLNALHPKFVGFAKQQLANGAQDGFIFLDKDLKEMYIEEISMRSIREGDIIYIVPTIVGGGGKNGLLMILAGVALFAAAPFLAPALGGLLGASAATGTAAAVAGVGGVTVAGLQATMTNIAVNLILAGFSALFTKKPKTADAATRNDMFGSLQNSTTSDTAVALHYGQVRAAGQFISGYILATEHSKSEVISVGDSFE